MAPSQLNNSSPQALIDDLEARMTHSGGNYRKTAQVAKQAKGHTKVAFTLNPAQRNALIGALGGGALTAATLRATETSPLPAPIDPDPNNSALRDLKDAYMYQVDMYKRYGKQHPLAATLLGAGAGAAAGYGSGSVNWQKIKDSLGK